MHVMLNIPFESVQLHDTKYVHSVLQPSLMSGSRTFLYNCIYLFLAALGLCCFVWAFSNCSRQGLLFVVVRGLLVPMASLVVERGI